MKNEKKYEFTNEQANELMVLRNMFDFMLKEVYPSLWALMNKSNLSKKETHIMQRELKLFDEAILMSKYRYLFLRMIDLIEMESKYNRQEFIQKMLDNEQYEILNCLKKANQLKDFFD